MPEPTPSTNPRYVVMAKDCLAVAREALLVAGFLMLLLLPERFNGLLERAGFTKGSLLGFEWEKTLKASTDQAKGAGDAISQVEGRLKDFVAQLEALDKKTTDPNVKSAIASISHDVQASLQETAKADRAAKSSLLTQQQLIAQVAPGSSTEAAAGWMYLGKTDAPDGKWLSGSPETIESVPTSALKPGARVRARDDVYLRADSATGQHNEGKVLSVLSRGREVEILSVQYPSRPWGAAAWAKVKR
jgi:hypothetical protein